MTATPPTDAPDPARLAGAPTSAPVPGWVPAGAGPDDVGGAQPGGAGPGDVGGATQGDGPAPTSGTPDGEGAGGPGAGAGLDAGTAGGEPGQEAAEQPKADAAQPVAPIPTRHKVESTRTSGLWTAVVAASLLLLVLVVFIAQNSHKVNIHFLWLTGNFSLGLALLVAAVIGALTVATVGVARTMQLRRTASRHRKSDALASAAKAPSTGSGAGSDPRTQRGPAAAPAGPTSGAVPGGSSAVATRPPAEPARKGGFWRRSKS